ncbi:N-acetylmuramoyl-L-alanine amidase [uncultured Endozoicomonas sp.]|uniref:N-acetylmuramoyl-L-alanine amidase n=1 Tax=uncultured Endozoicomonas sp. TaxID=432652 RepID=UPI0026050D3F|nr:N-acetylmuramoyl-L-alanine amidase [uncultured Endozoicomonas sp.]
MSLTVNSLKTKNRDDWEIPVEFLVLHYTAVNLEETLALFTNPESSVSSHLVIDITGDIYELVDCLDGRALRAWHAGVSEWAGMTGLNDCSIGIELVNYNGNVFPYTEAQYGALKQVMLQLKKHYPNLASPERVVGHEHIAGFRGKADPGLCFDWLRFYQESYPEVTAPDRQSVCPVDLQSSLVMLSKSEPESPEAKSDFWRSTSLLTETSIRLIQQASSTD